MGIHHRRQRLLDALEPVMRARENLLNLAWTPAVQAKFDRLGRALRRALDKVESLDQKEAGR